MIRPFSRLAQYRNRPGPRPRLQPGCLFAAAEAEMLLTATVALTLSAYDAKAICVSDDVCMLARHGAW